MAELRQNLITGDWVVIAAHRAMRPESFSREPKPPAQKRLSGCPFCAGNESQTPPEVFAVRPTGGAADGPGWDVRVVPNKYPAFTEAPGLVAAENHYASRAAIGRHEVIIHSPDHHRTLAQMSVAEVAAVFSVYQTRLKDLAKDPQLVSAAIIVNQGREAGASIEHPHSQLFALPLVAPTVGRELRLSQELQQQGGQCPACAMVEYEVSHQARLVAANDDFILFCPYASKVPFEMYLLPKAHQSDFKEAPADHLEAAAALVKQALECLGERLGDPPYNLYLHTAPFKTNGDYHWHFSILPKLSIIAGFEFATGIMINIAEPEAAAEFLRSAI